MVDEVTASELAGNIIRAIFKNTEEIAELHACITSSRGGNFRLRLLQAMEVNVDETVIEQLRVESGTNEYHRHLNRLMRFGLVRVQETDGKKQYIRTTLGEKAIDALREFERRVGEEAAKAVYSASLGPNSIRFFLRIYGDKREANWEHLQIKYTPAEIGKLSLFLPRIIEGVSAFDKLNEAGLLVYQDDNYIYMQPTRARSFYQYIQQLYGIIRANRNKDNIKHPGRP